MYFTLAVSAATRQACAALAGAAERTDPRVMPLPGPAMIGAFLSLGYPVGAATPFRGVRALGEDRALRLSGGRLVVTRACREKEQPAGPDRVAAALAEAVRPLGEANAPVELSLTGGKDSRLVAAALTAARVPFLARTHGFAGHPDVVVAGLIAGRLGLAALLSGDWLNAREPVSRART
jgi:asparagine synthetase B (glutamine-hydrolysing)